MKYNLKERQIIRKVYELQSMNVRYRKKYLDTEVKINALIHKLGGKYQPRRK